MKTGKTFFTLSILILSIFLISCQDSGLFSSAESAIEIITLEDGSILNRGDEIPISLHMEEDQIYRMVLTLYDEGDNNRGELSLESEEVDGDLPPLTLPDDLEDGYYRLIMTIFSGDEVLKEEQLTFFILAEQPRLRSLVSYPLVFLPRGKGIVIADAYIPQGQDPWVRWIFNQQILSQGLYSQGAGRVLVTAPAVNGIYTLRAELFPRVPPDGDSWSFSSPIYAETPVYVNSEVEAYHAGLDYPGSWYSLFHFHGEFGDWGDRSDPIEFSFPDGEPEIDVSRGIFGYRLNQGYGFKSGQFLFPVSEEGELQPFSLFLIFSLSETTTNKKILETRALDGGFRFLLETDETGVPVLTVNTPSNTILLSPSDSWSPGVYNPVILSVYPDYEHREISLLWYQDGSLVTSTKSGWNTRGFSSVGETTLGGESGGPEIIDELGVYYLDSQGRPSPAPDIFRTYSRETYGNRLFFADGFDSLSLDRELQSLLELNTGQAELIFSRLGLFPGAVFHFPGFRRENGIYSGIITVSEDSGDEIYLQIRQKIGEQTSLAGEFAEIPLKPGENAVTFQIKAGEGTVTLNGLSFNLTADSLEDPELIYWSLENRGTGMLFVQEIVILKEMLRLAEGNTGAGTSPVLPE